MVINLIVIYIIGFILTAYGVVKLEDKGEGSAYWLAILATVEALFWPLVVPFVLLALFVKLLFIRSN